MKKMTKSLGKLVHCHICNNPMIVLNSTLNDPVYTAVTPTHPLLFPEYNPYNVCIRCIKSKPKHSLGEYMETIAWCKYYIDAIESDVYFDASGNVIAVSHMEENHGEDLEIDFPYRIEIYLVPHYKVGNRGDFVFRGRGADNPEWLRKWGLNYISDHTGYSFLYDSNGKMVYLKQDKFPHTKTKLEDTIWMAGNFKEDCDIDATYKY